MWFAIRPPEVVAVSYTATFDASHKVKASGGHGTNFQRHIARDVDQAAGFEFQQRNVNIDPSRTAMNITRVNDGQGGWREPVVTQDAEGNDRPPSAELGDYLDERLATVDKKIKADAVAMRPMILQLDPKWFDEHNPDWRENGLNDEAQRHVDAQLEWVETEFSPDRRKLTDREASNANLVGYSIHLDETSPQMQVLFTPVTDDGRLSQKDFFKGPSDLQRQHKQHREALAASGYEVEFKVSKRSKERLSSEEYAATADKARAHEREAAQHLATAREQVEQSDFGQFFEQQHPEAFGQVLDEYTNEIEQRIREKEEQEHGQHHREGHGQGDGEDRAAADYGAVDDVGLGARSRQAADRETDEGRHGPDRVREGHGRGADEADRPGVDHSALRQHAAAEHERREQHQRDREDARRVRAESQRRDLESRVAELGRRSAEESHDHGLGR